MIVPTNVKRKVLLCFSTDNHIYNTVYYNKVTASLHLLYSCTEKLYKHMCKTYKSVSKLACDCKG